MGLMKALALEVEQFKRSQAVQRNAEAKARRSYRQTTGFDIETVLTTKYDPNFPNDFADAIQRRVMRAAMRKAANKVRKRQRQILKPHQSAKTGTSKKWSKKAQDRNAKRSGVYKSIIARVRYDKRSGNIVATIGPDYYDTWVGWFLEVGREIRYWQTDETGEQEHGTTKPLAFVKRAGRETKTEQDRVITEHIKKNWGKV